ncbi:MAG: 3-oxoacyl-ACP reductase FabG [Actinomycetota bacterium]|nr:3-oxoacyl-ACP reductase FabG [Actinomycetota bacterium]
MPERIALVTGASRGIGRGAAVALARRGVAVAINYRSAADEAKETLRLVEGAGGTGICVQGDVSVTDSIDALFAEVSEALGEVSILVNNAGIRRDGLALSMSDDAWHEVLETNLFGPFACARRALRPMLRQRWGRIVNVTSVAGLKGSPGQANYAAAKAGLVGLTRTLAREVGSKGITVNAVAPGPVATDFTSELSGDQWNRLLGEMPVGRAGTAEEIGELIAFVCSEEASFLNGGVFVADGGMTA